MASRLSPLAPITLVGALILAGCASVQTDAGVHSAADLPTNTSLLGVTGGEQDGGEGARILEWLDLIEFAEDGSYVGRDRRTIAVETEQAARTLATLQVRWSPWTETRPEVMATVITADGRTLELDPATIDDAPSRETTAGILSDARTLTVTLPGVRAGAQIRQEVIRHRLPPTMMGGLSDALLFADMIPIAGRVVVVSFPEALPLRWRLHGEDVPVERRSIGDRVQLTFTGGPAEAWESGELLAPPEETLPTTLYLATGASWSDLAARYSGIVDQQLAGADLTAVVSEVVGPGMSRDETAAALLAWLHANVRYTGLEYDEASVVPRTPSETLSRGFGDCKDQATLMVQLLRTAGIPAEVALLRAGPGPEIQADLPALDVFDHAIVHVPGPAPLWIDATHPYVGIGDLPDRDRGRLALVATAGTGGLVTTPAPHADRNTYHELREIHLEEEGPAQIVERRWGMGAEDEALREAFADFDPDSERGDLESSLMGAYGDVELVNVTYGAPEGLTAPFEVKVEAQGATHAVTEGSEAWVVLDEGELFINGYTLQILASVHSDTPRTAALQLPSIGTREIRYEILPPTGFEPVDLPADEELPFGPARLTRRFAWSDGLLTVTLTFNSGPALLNAEDANALLTAFRDWQQAKKLVVHLRHRGAVLIDEGDAAGGVALFRSVAEAWPKDAVAQARYADALIDVGMGLEARRVAQRAVERAPTSATALRALGRASMHDPLGRPGAEGADWSTAKEAFAQALEIDPDDIETQARQAQVLGALSLRFDADASLKEDAAVAWRRLLEAEGASDALRDKAVMALASLEIGRGKGAAAVEPIRAHASAELRPFLVAMCQAGAGDAQAADSTLAKSGFGVPERVTALLGMSVGLVSGRRYDEARALLDYAGRVAPGALRSEVAHQRAELEGLRRSEDLTPDIGTPEGATIGLLLAHLRGDEKALGALVHPSFAAALAGDLTGGEDEAVLRSFGAGGSLKASGQGFNMAADWMMAKLRLQSTGSAHGAYRVRLSLEGMADSATSSLYLVADGRGWRLRADSAHPDAMAEAAEERLAQGDTQGARQWLEWAVVDASRGKSATDDEAPLAVLWRSDLRETREGLAVLAAAARTSASASPDAVARMEAARESAQALPTQIALDRALARGYIGLKRYEEALAALDHAAQLTGAPMTTFYPRLHVLGLLDREDDLAAEVARYAADHPDDVRALGWLGSHLMEAGALVSSAQVWEEVLERDPHDAVALNNRAWLAPFLGEVTALDVERARAAVAEDGGKSASTLNTLATLLAERGDTEEAMDTLRASLDARDGEVEPSDWYAVGRIAEIYGLNGAAHEAYAKALEDEDRPTSAGRLAEGRMVFLAGLR